MAESGGPACRLPPLPDGALTGTPCPPAPAPCAGKEEPRNPGAYARGLAPEGAAATDFTHALEPAGAATTAALSGPNATAAPMATTAAAATLVASTGITQDDSASATTTALLNTTATAAGV